MSGKLILTRKLNESVMIGDDIEVTVAEVLSGNKIRLGFKAPDDVKIYRKEVYDNMKEDAVKESENA